MLVMYPHRAGLKNMPGHSDFLDQQMIQNAFDGMISRAQRCIQAQRHAFPDE